MKKCRTYKCKARCCYNVPFEEGELDKYADKMVNPVLGVVPILGAMVPLTGASLEKNKCPFLRADFLCNIYENRPEVCRKMGEVDKMKCEFYK